MRNFVAVVAPIDFAQGGMFRMNGRSAEVGALVLFQGRHQLGEVQSLVDLDQQAVGVEKSRNCLLVNWNRVEIRLKLRVHAPPFAA